MPSRPHLNTAIFRNLYFHREVKGISALQVNSYLLVEKEEKKERENNEIIKGKNMIFIN